MRIFEKVFEQTALPSLCVTAVQVFADGENIRELKLALLLLTFSPGSRELLKSQGGNFQSESCVLGKLVLPQILPQNTFTKKTPHNDG